MLCSNNGRKSQSSMIILVGIIAVFSVVWIVMMFSSTSFQKRMVKEIKLTKLSKYLDMFKGFSRESLLLSSHAAVKEVARSGGERMIDETRSWICNSDVSPSVTDIRFFLSEETLQFMNEYLKGISVEDYIELEVDAPTCVDYDVTQSSVESRKNDEGFNVGAYGSSITISQEDDTAYSESDIYEEIPQVRFWYMYRKFKEWSEKNVLAKYVCGCLPTACCCPSGECKSSCSSFDNCVNDAIERALQDLKDTFDDPYISCTANKKCCFSESATCEGTPGCSNWDAPECNKCYKESPGELCSETVGLSSGNVYEEEKIGRIRLAGSCEETTKPEVKCDNRISEHWEDTRGATEVVFRCKDSKYLLSTKGDRNLAFSVHANVKLKEKNCYEWTNCVCEYECAKCGCSDPNYKYDSDSGNCENPVTGKVMDAECKEQRCVECKSSRPPRCGRWCEVCKEVPEPPPPLCDPKKEECPSGKGSCFSVTYDGSSACISYTPDDTCMNAGGGGHGHIFYGTYKAPGEGINTVGKLLSDNIINLGTSCFPYNWPSFCIQCWDCGEGLFEREPLCAS